jgi:hypothetical protein
MNFEPIILHVQEYGIAYFGIALVILPLLVVFRKYTLPFIYHSVEYILYCAVAHVMIGGLVRAFSWFRSETTFKSFDDSAPVASFKTPIAQGFWQKELYNPEWLFWFEVGVAALLLYVVIFVRPVKFKQKPYKSKKPAPGQLSSRDGRPKQYTVNVK